MDVWISDIDDLFIVLKSTALFSRMGFLDEYPGDSGFSG